MIKYTMKSAYPFFSLNVSKFPLKTDEKSENKYPELVYFISFLFFRLDHETIISPTQWRPLRRGVFCAVES